MVTTNKEIKRGRPQDKHYQLLNENERERLTRMIQESPETDRITDNMKEWLSHNKRESNLFSWKPENWPYRISTAMLPTVLKSLNISFAEFGYEEDDGTVVLLANNGWPNARANAIAELLDCVEEDLRLKIEQQIGFFMQDIWLLTPEKNSAKMMKKLPGTRTAWHMHSKYGVSIGMKKSGGDRRHPADNVLSAKHLEPINQLFQTSNSLPYKNILNYCMDEGLSPHWILCLPSNETLIAQHASTERIMDMILLQTDGKRRANDPWQYIPAHDRQKDLYYIVLSVCKQSKMPEADEKLAAARAEIEKGEI